MKKIVSIVAALAMATAMFADPAFTGTVSEFTASASVTWGIDLDRGTTGFKNGTSASLKVSLFGSDSKATASDETVWGEIAIGTDGVAIENGSVVCGTKDLSAKLHVGPAWVGIMSGHTHVGAYSPVLATSSDVSYLTTGNAGADADQGINIGYKMDNMFSAELNFRSVKAAPVAPATDKYWNGGNADYYSDKYALSLNVTFDMVENLGVAFGVSKDLTVNKKLADKDVSDVALFGKVDYKLALGDSKFYVKPGVGAVWQQTDNMAAGAKVAAGVLLGWGSENQDTNIKYMNKDVSDGFSVGTEFMVAKTKTWIDKDDNMVLTGIVNEDIAAGALTAPKLIFGVWDSATLVPNLTFGAEVKVANVYNTAWKATVVSGGKDVSADAREAILKGQNNTVYISSLIAEAKYAVALDDKTITPKVAAKFESTEVTDEDAMKKVAETGDKTYKLYATGFYFGVDFAGFVPYTTFSVDYETVDATVDYMYKGHLDFTCKISF